jgi:putative hydroxymethylpyrimidine transport system ATP-binding protein
MSDQTPISSFDISVKIDHLDFDARPLFRDLAFDIAGGGWTCLLGASGVGKTTLLRLVAGLLEDVASATVTCSDGEVLPGQVTYMAQQDLLLPWLSVLDNVLIGRRLRYETISGADINRAQDLLAKVGLENESTLLPATLSGGMRQRAALARTLMEDRPVVLMDEPFSALDAITRVQLQDLAAELLADRTVLLVTHDPLEALRLGHRIHVLSGRPAALDEPLTFADAIPRDLHDTTLLARQAELLDRLRQSAAEMAA